MKNIEDIFPVTNVIITDKNGSNVYDLNELTLLAYQNQLQVEPSPNMICDVTGTAPAIHYLSKGESYYLNKKALRRLILHSLKPKEYQILAKKYGPTSYMLHDDFYDKDGTALQPHD